MKSGSTQPRLRRVVRVFMLLCATLAIFALPAWRIGIRLMEGPAATGVANTPSCQGILVPGYERAVAQARASVTALRAEQRIPGMSVAVSVRGRVVWSEGFGYADLAAHTPACPSTKFRIGSVSKPITTTALARLVEAGVVDPDARVQRYVPNFPNKSTTIITAHQLAAHRAGIRHYYDDNEAINTKAYATSTAYLEKFANDTLLFEPGSDFHYTSYGYVLLGALLEGATGKTFPAVVQEQVLDPLGMLQTVPEITHEHVPARAQLYDHVTPYSTDGSVVPSPFTDNSGKWPAGGFLSTAEDMVKLGSMQLGYGPGEFLTRASRRLLVRPQSRQFVFGYGLGWMSGFDARLRRFNFHFGAQSGGTAFIAVYPESDVAVAIVANLGHAGFSFPRLMGVVNPFAGEGRLGWVLFGGLALAGVFVWIWQLRLRRQAPHVIMPDAQTAATI